MEIASYEIVGSGGSWRVKHDGEPIGRACYERQKKHANNTSTISIFATFTCCRRSVLPPRPFALTEDKIVLGELGQFDSPVHARHGTS
ncbi:hypothetical protein SAMN05444170_0798 [Bradyrhizobium erythrophlei]|uniref:DUF2188 domain-containing protein n=1 Tax=Bradyrhizobium erythrophlei TaxID=1437360 RepID=A0A1M7T570_9BRAD|nr:hypothetical protein SAMN05444170_0798 [Bradyrhizobium erythrophlei]